MYVGGILFGTAVPGWSFTEDLLRQNIQLSEAQTLQTRIIRCIESVRSVSDFLPVAGGPWDSACTLRPSLVQLSKWRSGRFSDLNHIAKRANVSNWPHSVDVVLSNSWEPEFRQEIAQMGWNGTYIYFSGRGTRRWTPLTLSLPYARNDARVTNKAVCVDHHWCVPGPFDDSVDLLLGKIANPTVWGPMPQLDPALFGKVTSKKPRCHRKARVSVYGEKLIPVETFDKWKTDPHCKGFEPLYGPNETEDGFTFFNNSFLG